MRWDGENNRSRTAPVARLLVAHRAPLIGAAVVALAERLGHSASQTVSDWQAMCAAAETGAYDMAVLDIELDPPGQASLAFLVARVRTIVLAPAAGHPGLLAALESGIAGLVLATESVDSFRLCLATVAGGGRWVESVAMTDVAERAAARHAASLLTRREGDVARLVAAGQRNRAIASSLGISEGTVKMHLHNVYAKLGLQSRTQLALDERLRMRG